MSSGSYRRPNSESGINRALNTSVSTTTGLRWTTAQDKTASRNAAASSSVRSSITNSPWAGCNLARRSTSSTGSSRDSDGGDAGCGVFIVDVSYVSASGRSTPARGQATPIGDSERRTAPSTDHDSHRLLATAATFQRYSPMKRRPFRVSETGWQVVSCQTNGRGLSFRAAIQAFTSARLRYRVTGRGGRGSPDRVRAAAGRTVNPSTNHEIVRQPATISDALRQIACSSDAGRQPAAPCGCQSPTLHPQVLGSKPTGRTTTGQVKAGSLCCVCGIRTGANPSVNPWTRGARGRGSSVTPFYGGRTPDGRRVEFGVDLCFTTIYVHHGATAIPHRS